MAKITMTFDSYEDREEMTTALHAGAFKSAIHDFDNYLRSIIKYTDQETIDPEEVRAKLHAYLNENDCSLWE